MHYNIEVAAPCLLGFNTWHLVQMHFKEPAMPMRGLNPVLLITFCGIALTKRIKILKHMLQVPSFCICLLMLPSGMDGYDQPWYRCVPVDRFHGTTYVPFGIGKYVEVPR